MNKSNFFQPARKHVVHRKLVSVASAVVSLDFFKTNIMKKHP
jgi:hypothetical protein